MPVKIIAMACSLAAAMTSSSLMEPPGWMTAAAPAFAASSTSGTDRRRQLHRRAFRPTMGGRAHDRDLGRIHAAHLTGTHAENLIR